MEGLNFFDTAIMCFVQAYLHNPVTDIVFAVITYLGEAGAIWIVFSVLLLFHKKWHVWGILSLLALLVIFITGEVIIKNIVCRPRPFVEFPNFTTLLIHAPTGFSFPSGHSGLSFATATVLLCAHKRLGVFAMIFACLIAFSRVFLFVHYPTDILAGMALGILVGFGIVWVYRYMQKRHLFLQ